MKRFAGGQQEPRFVFGRSHLGTGSLQLPHWRQQHATPSSGSQVPIGSDWGKLSRLPCQLRDCCHYGHEKVVSKMKVKQRIRFADLHCRPPENGWACNDDSRSRLGSMVETQGSPVDEAFAELWTSSFRNYRVLTAPSRREC